MDVFVKVMFIIVPVLVLAGFVVTLLSIFSPRFRAAVERRQLRGLTYMARRNKDDMKDAAAAAAEVGVEAQQRILEEQGEGLSDMMAAQSRVNLAAAQKVMDGQGEQIKDLARQAGDMGVEVVHDVVMGNRQKVAATAAAVKDAVSEEPRCPHCGQTVGTADRFCRHCGQPLG